MNTDPSITPYPYDSNIFPYIATEAKRQELLRKYPELLPFEEHGYKIGTIADITGMLRGIASEFPEELEQIGNIANATLIEVQGPEDEGIHSRRVVLMENNQGERTYISVAKHEKAEGEPPLQGEEYNPVLHGPAHFGGAGIYGQKDSELPLLVDAMQHSEKLAQIMTKKAVTCGVGNKLGGSKTIITGYAWLEDPAFQLATGMLFSRRGVWPDVITGSDSGQTEQTIAMMQLGSELGGGIGQIVGTKEGLPDTASYVRISIEAAYQALCEIFGDQVPDITKTPAAVQGMGKIGYTTARQFLEMGCPVVYVTDVFENSPRIAILKEHYRDRVIFVGPDAIWDTDAQIFSPCSNQEGIVTKDKVERLEQGGCKVILSGANGPLESVAVAQHIHNLGIIMLDETITNNGSATAAALEVEYLIRGERNVDKFIEERLSPHIRTNVNDLIRQCAQISSTQGVSLYEAGEIAIKQLMG